MGNDFKIRIIPIESTQNKNTTTKQDPNTIYSILISFSKKIYLLFFALCAVFIVLFFRHKSEFTETASLDTQLDSVSSRIMGYVKSVHINEGDHVKEGDVIASLDLSDFIVEKKIKAVKLEKAKHDLNRAKQLAKQSGISKADLESAQINFSANQADLEATELKLKYSQILAPITGTIARRSIQVGQFIQPGQILFIIVPENKLWVTALFKESQIIKIYPGQRAIISVDAVPNLLIIGTVREIMPASLSKLSLIPADNSTGHFSKVIQRFAVIIDLKQPPPVLRPGMSASVEVTLDPT